ncbi:MAG: SRPBCC family protein [Pirellulaceae bacterium]|jgi:uncharacterized protein YndB with AHSA1/START domain|nr:SRPBCC family protein [Pirellulaceae bacterium]
MKTTFTIDIDAPPSKVFYWLTDSDRLLEWVPNLIEHEEIENLDGVVGSTDRHVYLENDRRTEMEGVVVAYEQDERVATELRSKGFMLFLDYRLEDLGGSTRLTQDCDVVFRGFFKIIGICMGRLVKKGAEQKLAESFGVLKQKIESS